MDCPFIVSAAAGSWRWKASERRCMITDSECPWAYSFSYAELGDWLPPCDTRKCAEDKASETANRGQL